MEFRDRHFLLLYKTRKVMQVANCVKERRIGMASGLMLYSWRIAKKSGRVVSRHAWSSEMYAQQIFILPRKGGDKYKKPMKRCEECQLWHILRPNDSRTPHSDG